MANMPHTLLSVQSIDFTPLCCIYAEGRAVVFAGSGLHGNLDWDNPRRVAAWTLNPRLTRSFQVAFCPIAAEPESI